jgi:hypothetical protein
MMKRQRKYFTYLPIALLLLSHNMALAQCVFDSGHYHCDTAKACKDVQCESYAEDPQDYENYPYLCLNCTPS